MFAFLPSVRMFGTVMALESVCGGVCWIVDLMQRMLSYRESSRQSVASVCSCFAQRERCTEIVVRVSPSCEKIAAARFRSSSVS